MKKILVLVFLAFSLLPIVAYAQDQKPNIVLVFMVLPTVFPKTSGLKTSGPKDPTTSKPPP